MSAENENDMSHILTSIYECALSWVARENGERRSALDGWDKAEALMVAAPALRRTLSALRDQAASMHSKRSSLHAQDWVNLDREIRAATLLLSKLSD